MSEPENPLDATEQFLEEGQRARAAQSMKTMLLLSGAISFALTFLLAALAISPWGKRALALAGADADVATHERTKVQGNLAVEVARSGSLQERHNELSLAAGRTLDRLEEDLKPAQEKWAREVGALKTDSRGREIAASTGLLERFVELTETKPPQLVDLELTKSRLQEIKTTSEALAAAPGVSAPPDGGAVAQVQAAERRVEDALAAQTEALLDLEALSSKAMKDELPPAPQSLEEALKSRRVEAKEAELANLLKRIDEKLVHVREEQDRIAKENAEAIAALRIQAAEDAARAATEHEARMAELEKEAQRLALTAEQQKQMDELAKTAALGAAEQEERARATQAISDAAAKKALIAKCNDPTIKNKLRYFTTKGILRPHGKTLKPEPLSYSDLSAIGALEKTDKGIQKLYELASSPVDKERPRASRVSSFLWATSDVRKELVEAQELLLELGPTLIELKLLNP